MTFPSKHLRAARPRVAAVARRRNRSFKQLRQPREGRKEIAMLNYNLYETYKDNLRVWRSKLESAKKELENLNRAQMYTWNDEDFDSFTAELQEKKREIRKIEYNVRSIETTLKKFNFKPATVA